MFTFSMQMVHDLLSSPLSGKVRCVSCLLQFANVCHDDEAHQPLFWKTIVCDKSANWKKILQTLWKASLFKIVKRSAANQFVKLIYQN